MLLNANVVILKLCFVCLGADTLNVMVGSSSYASYLGSVILSLRLTILTEDFLSASRQMI